MGTQPPLSTFGIKSYYSKNIPALIAEHIHSTTLVNELCVKIQIIIIVTRSTPRGQISAKAAQYLLLKELCLGYFNIIFFIFFKDMLRSL